VIFGLEPSEPLPAGWTPLDAVAVVKALDEDGELAFAVRSTVTLSDWECFALLRLAASVQEREIMEGFDDG
jgi:hypothetical protein